MHFSKILLIIQVSNLDLFWIQENPWHQKNSMYQCIWDVSKVKELRGYYQLGLKEKQPKNAFKLSKIFPNLQCYIQKIVMRNHF